MSNVECIGNTAGRGPPQCSSDSLTDDFEVNSRTSGENSDSDDSNSNSQTSGAWDGYIDRFCKPPEGNKDNGCGTSKFGANQSPAYYEKRQIVSNSSEKYSNDVLQGQSNPGLPSGTAQSECYIQPPNSAAISSAVPNAECGISQPSMAHENGASCGVSTSHNITQPTISNRNFIHGQLHGSTVEPLRGPFSYGTAPAASLMHQRDVLSSGGGANYGYYSELGADPGANFPRGYSTVVPQNQSEYGFPGGRVSGTDYSTLLNTMSVPPPLIGEPQGGSSSYGVAPASSLVDQPYDPSIATWRKYLLGSGQPGVISSSWIKCKNFVCGGDKNAPNLNGQRFEGADLQESSGYLSEWFKHGTKGGKKRGSREKKKMNEPFRDMTGDVTDSKKLDINKLLQLAKAIETEIKVLKGRDIALVIGKTGCGKSTVVNYLLEKKLIRARDDTGEIIFELDRLTVQDNVDRSDDEQSAKIGHEFVSETLVPKGFETGKSFLWCDTPGFKDNRSSENDAATYLALQMLAKTAACIKGIIVVVSVDDFKNRAAGLYETLSLLQRLILPNENCLSNYRNSVIFIFTHADDCMGEVKTAKQIENLLKKVQSGLETQIAGDPSNERLEASLALCYIMRKGGVKTVVFDPINEQCRGRLGRVVTGRDCILDFIEKSKGIAKEDMAFRVERIFQRYSDTFCELANSYLICRMTISEEQSRIEEHKEKIANIEKQISKLEEIIAHVEEFGRKHKGLEAELEKTIHEIDVLRGRIARQNNKLEDVQRERNELANDNTLTLVHTANVYLENDVYGVVKKGEIKNYTFDYSQSFPIANVECKGGKYDETEGSSQNFSAPSYNEPRTEVKVKYTGPSHEYGRAEFTIYSEKRSTPDGKCELERYDRELKCITKNLDDLESDLKHAKEMKKCILEKKLQIEEQCKEELIESNKLKIAEYKEKGTKLAKEMEESNQKVKSAEELLSKEEKQYKMLAQFHAIAPFEEKTILEFISKFACANEHETE